jgi:hypothetical protein
MAVTNISTGLSSFNPTYNPLVYMFNSNNTNQTGFRYVVDVYSGTSSTKIYEGRVAPRPTDGWGYIDVSKIVADYITWDVDLTSSTNIHANDSYFNYTVKIGEEYMVEWPFVDTFFVSGGRVLVTGTTTNSFLTNDQVIITQNNPALIPSLEGLQTVYSAVTSQSFIVDVGFLSTSANTGTVKYANGSKTIYRDLLTYSSQTAFNTAFKTNEWINYDSNDYLLSGASTTRKILTNIPNNFYCTPTQDLFVNVAFRYGSDATQIRFQNDQGDLFFKTGGTINTINQYAVGPNNIGTLTLVSGTTTLVKSDTKYYDFWLHNSGGNQMCEKVRVYIDRKCGIEDYEILFLDRKGSFSSFSFPLRSERTLTGNRTSYNQQIGGLVSGKWNYSNSDAGEITTNISVSEDIRLRTGYLTSEMSTYFSELVFSPVTFVKIDGEYYSCVVETKSYKPQSPRLKKLNTQEITIKLAQENPTNI